MFAQVFVGCGVTALVWRRLSEFWFIRRTILHMRKRREQIVASPQLPQDYPWIVVLLPLHREQLLVQQLFDHFRNPDYPPDRLRVVFITTEKEQRIAGPTTAELLNDILLTGSPAHFVHLHYPRNHRFRADQMNFALREICSKWPDRETYVAVYNADSLPDRDTFRLLAADALIEKRRTGIVPPAYQQGIRYFVPKRYKRPMIAHTVAALQTVYTCAHLMRRIDSSTPGSGTPVTFTGHGEFIRLDVVRSVGMFPGYAYADGLLMGWEVAFAGNSIRLLPAFDHCEVPQGIRATVLQHKAWFLGLLNLTEAVKHRFGGVLSIRESGFRTFIARRMLATLTWGFRTAFLVSLSLAAALCGGWYLIAAVAVIVLFGIAPLIYADLVWPELSALAPGEANSPALFLRRMLAAVPAMLIDGCGFWPALKLRIFAAESAPMPPGTER